MGSAGRSVGDGRFSSCGDLPNPRPGFHSFLLHRCGLLRFTEDWQRVCGRPGIGSGTVSIPTGDSAGTVFVLRTEMEIVSRGRGDGRGGRGNFDSNYGAGSVIAIEIPATTAPVAATPANNFHFRAKHKHSTSGITSWNRNSPRPNTRPAANSLPIFCKA